jgi:hypothetical protein
LSDDMTPATAATSTIVSKLDFGHFRAKGRRSG